MYKRNSPCSATQVVEILARKEMNKYGAQTEASAVSLEK
jgi:hypothetical protein